MEHEGSDVGVKNMTTILEELSRNGLKVGDTRDNTFAGSLCIMILQKITGKYHVASSFQDYCLVPSLKRDWEQLTSKLEDSSEFTRAMIQIYFGEYEQDSKRADIISLFAAHLDMSEEDVTNQMLRPDSVLMLEDVFHPIVPEQDYYTNPEDYMSGLMHDFEDQSHPSQFAVQFLNRSQDIIQVINSLVNLEENLKSAPSFDNLDSILRPVDENNILYLLRRISIVSKTVSSTKEIDEHLKNFKERMVEALEEGLRQLLCQRRDVAKHNIKLHTCVPEDVDRGMEQLRIRIRREQSKLEQEGISENNVSQIAYLVPRRESSSGTNEHTGGVQATDESE